MSLWQLTLQRAFSLSAYSRKSLLAYAQKPSSIASSTRASQDQLDAWKSTRTSHSLNSTSLLSIFILMVSIFLSNSFPFSLLSNSFTDCWDLELAAQHEFATNLWAEELEKDELSKNLLGERD